MMNGHVDVSRAWKDPAYRASLTESQRSALPENPAGTMELTDAELGHVEGGYHAGGFAAMTAVAKVQFNASWVDACPSALGCTFDIGRVAVINPAIAKVKQVVRGF